MKVVIIRIMKLYGLAECHSYIGKRQALVMINCQSKRRCESQGASLAANSSAAGGKKTQNHK